MTQKIKINRAVRSAIYQAARRCVRGSSPLVEIGLRAGLKHTCIPHFQANELLWEEESDLEDLVPLAKLAELEFDARGRCSLDLYVYTGRSRELETNVAAWLHKDGKAVRLLGTWRYDQAPDYDRSPEEIETAWENIISKNLVSRD